MRRIIQRFQAPETAGKSARLHGRDIYALSQIPGRRIGLLGGSFNPAHDGHRHISLMALQRLRLHQVWWLVSPQNPLKPADGMAPFDERLAFARTVAHHPRIHVSNIEAELQTRYTADTLHALRQRCPGVHFVWLMGADNLAQMPQWKNWTGVFDEAPVAVFARPTYSLLALAGKAAHRYARIRLSNRAVEALATSTPPVWAFLHIRLHPASAAEIRAARDADAGRPATPLANQVRRGVI